MKLSSDVLKLQCALYARVESRLMRKVWCYRANSDRAHCSRKPAGVLLQLARARRLDKLLLLRSLVSYFR